MFEPHPMLEPGLTTCERYPVMGWRLCVRDSLDVLIGRSADLKFGSQRDAELAIESFRQAGILTRDDFYHLTDSQLRQLATRFLFW